MSGHFSKTALAIALFHVACGNAGSRERQDLTLPITLRAKADRALRAPVSSTQIEVDLAGDVVPHGAVLASDIHDIVASLPTFWHAADARVVNLEAPISDQRELGVDKNRLRFFAPHAFFSDLIGASRSTAVVFANNHACDGTDQTLRDTYDAANSLTRVAGLDPKDAWNARTIATREGKHVCLVAWTTFINDERRGRHCGGESSAMRLAYANTRAEGLRKVAIELSKPERFTDCDARIAYIHGGHEYRAHPESLVAVAASAAPYVDAIVMAHSHVPDDLSIVSAIDSRTRKAHNVPVYYSLGNFVTNQGAGWSVGMSTRMKAVEGRPDPIRSVWTRVGMIARLRFEWSPGNELKTSFGYGLTFAARERKGWRIRSLESQDGIESLLADSSDPTTRVLSHACRMAEERFPCSSENVNP